MQRVCVAALLLISLACASSGSLGQSSSYYADKQQLFMAVQGAVSEIGGRIILSNQSSGTVVGRFDLEGTPVDLSIDITGSPSPDAGVVGDYNVSARASLVGDRDPDEEWKRQLKILQEDFFEALAPLVRRTGQQTMPSMGGTP